MTFLAPSYLLLLFLVPLLWFLPERLRDARQGWLRTACFVALIVALARPVRVSDEALDHHVVIFDRSSSTAESFVDTDSPEVVAWINHLSADAEVSVVDITNASASGEAHDDRRGVARNERVSTEREESPLGTALLAGVRAIPRGTGGAITLVSDGLATRRDWGPALQEISRRGIPLSTVALPAINAHVLRPVQIRVPAPLRVGVTGRVEIDVVGEGTAERVALTGPSGELASATNVACSGRARVVLEFEPRAPGFVPVEVAVTAAPTKGASAAEKTRRTTLAIQDPRPTLYVGERVRGSLQELQKLIGPGFDLRAADGSQPLRDLARYDLAIVDDRPAARIAESIQQELVQEVQQRGLGLFAGGGEASFGPGGFHRTPIASVLPIEFVQKEEKKDPSTAVAVIIDTSGSMSGNRIRLAKEVTRLAIKRLLPHDKVGIVEFYGTKRWAAPLQSAANAIDIQRALNRLDAGGGTILMPAIEEAYYGLKNVQTRYKHVLVLTDAGVESGAYESILRRMSRDGICVSTILVGPERHSEFLVELADWGNGRFYNASDRFNLPEIMLKQPSTARLPAYRRGVHEVQTRGGSGWWGPSDRSQIPSVAGYVETRSRPGSEVLIETQKDAHPVLATWRHGLGRVTALTTEPTGPGTRPWREWEDYGPLLARVLDRTADDNRFPYEVTLAPDNERLLVTVKSRRHDAPRPRGRVSSEDGKRLGDLDFRPIAVGLYEAEWFRDPQAGVYLFVGSEDRRLGEHRYVSPPGDGSSAEDQVDPQRTLDLERAAAATGGASRTLDADRSWATLAGWTPPTSVGPRPRSLSNLTPWFLLISLIAFVGEIAYRRSPRKRSEASA